MQPTRIDAHDIYPLIAMKLNKFWPSVPWTLDHAAELAGVLIEIIMSQDMVTPTIKLAD